MKLTNEGIKDTKAWTDKGYEVTSAKVSYTLAWRPKDSETEYAVCLANIVLANTTSNENVGESMKYDKES